MDLAEMETGSVPPADGRSRSRRAGPRPRRRAWVVALALMAAGAAALVLLGDSIAGRAAAIASVALALWLSELVPPFVPTFVLLAGVPLALGTRAPAFGLSAVLGWCADPVLALFLGGFALGRAARRHGLDARVAAASVRLARGRRERLLALVMASTAFLSMWMSNIAAAAIMIGVAGPLAGADRRFRTALALGVAMAANLGGMGTPIGTGPNAIAIARLEPRAPGFLEWMLFAVPLTAVMLAVAWLLLSRAYAVGGRFEGAAPSAAPLGRPARATALLFACAVAAWLTESWHHLSPAVVALALIALLFGSGLLGRQDVRELEWPTLLLVAGGLVLGRLLERSGLVEAATAGIPWQQAPPVLRLAGVLMVCALLSALMSNTAATGMLVPFAMAIDPSPATPVLVALSASFGVPFVISTPPNAMAVADGTVTGRDLLRVGLPIMLLGLLLLVLTGPSMLSAFGVR